MLWLYYAFYWSVFVYWEKESNCNLFQFDDGQVHTASSTFTSCSQCMRQLHIRMSKWEIGIVLKLCNVKWNCGFKPRLMCSVQRKKNCNLLLYVRYLHSHKYTHSHETHHCFAPKHIAYEKRPLLLLCNSLNDFKSLLGITYVVYTMLCISVYGRFEIPRVLLILVSFQFRFRPYYERIEHLRRSHCYLNRNHHYDSQSYIGSNLISPSLSVSVLRFLTLHVYFALVFAVRSDFTSNQLNSIAV